MNRITGSKRINQPWNKPRFVQFNWDEWLREWSDALEDAPATISGDWSRTVFCSGFFFSGSSAIADCLYDSLNQIPPPRETVAFRESRLPALIEGKKSLRDFLLESVLGVSANPSDRRHRWLEFAVEANLLSQTRSSSIIERATQKTHISAARLAHAFLAPQNELLVLDNALYREHTIVARHYVGSQWILVLRDLPSHYAQLRARGQNRGGNWSVNAFCDFVESSLAETSKNLEFMSKRWVNFNEFILNLHYRSAILDAIQPGLTVKSANYFRPDESAKNTRLGQQLAIRDRVTLERAEKRLYEHIDFSATGGAA